jgi:hypothetical protein
VVAVAELVAALLGIFTIIRGWDLVREIFGSVR